MKRPYEPEGYAIPFTTTGRPNPEILERWDAESDWLRLTDVVYLEEIEEFYEECDGYLPTVAHALLREKMRAHSARVTGFDDIEWADEERYIAPTADPLWSGDSHHARARKFKCAVGLTRTQWRLVRAAYEWRCAYCRARGRLHMDHVVPMAHRGAHRVDNVVPACPACNSSKGAKSLTDWLDVRTDLDARAIFVRMATATRTIAGEAETERRAA